MKPINVEYEPNVDFSGHSYSNKVGETGLDCKGMRRGKNGESEWILHNLFMQLYVVFSRQRYCSQCETFQLAPSLLCWNKKESCYCLYCFDGQTIRNMRVVVSCVTCYNTRLERKRSRTEKCRRCVYIHNQDSFKKS
jgi:hypothetical protein